MSSEKQHFSCYRFWRIIQKSPVIISTEASENRVGNSQWMQKGRKLWDISKTCL